MSEFGDYPNSGMDNRAFTLRGDWEYSRARFLDSLQQKQPTRSWPNDYVWIPNYTGRSTDEAMLARIADSQEAE